MRTIKSFDPIVDNSAKILILGSMPGILSLNKNQYYAKKSNAFWRIMGSIFNFDYELSYKDCIEALQSSGIALWDVLHSCARSGSLDSAIEASSLVPNNFQSFFKEYPNIQLVGFNGKEAEKIFSKYVLPTLDSDGVNFVSLPSSSAAYAIKLEKKIDIWCEALTLRSPV